MDVVKNFRGYTEPNSTCGYSCENWTGKTAKSSTM